MLREQRAEAEILCEERAVRLEGLLEEWKTKYAALRWRFSLETEGFRRDADNIGRYFFVPFHRVGSVTFSLLSRIMVGRRYSGPGMYSWARYPNGCCVCSPARFCRSGKCTDFPPPDCFSFFNFAELLSHGALNCCCEAD